MGGAGVVGRLRERVLLSGALEEAARSRGRVMLLTGEDAETARGKLTAAGGVLRRAIAGMAP